MFEAGKSPYLVPYDGSFRVSRALTEVSRKQLLGKKDAKKRLKELVAEINHFQQILWARDTRSLLLIFQAMDAAGKDGTIRAVLTGVNPAGCEVYSFKQPSALELDHDFLWRTALRVPERGRIGVFNRSYYEEVLIVRVHPGLLENQSLPYPIDPKRFWKDRFASIRAWEEHLARSGTVILKFWLNVSKEEQRRRFLSRLDEPEKNWKFSSADVKERGCWDDYMKAYEEALNATSRPWAPWYAIPADDKRNMRVAVARILRDTLASFDLSYPEVDEAERARFAEMRTLLEGESTR
jgi:PPK2 family polyphosphate:nucleotide phosphotransferase